MSELALDELTEDWGAVKLIPNTYGWDSALQRDRRRARLRGSEGWALHPLIWGIGVKRKFSASRTAFLRKL